MHSLIFAMSMSYMRQALFEIRCGAVPFMEVKHNYLRRYAPDQTMCSSSLFQCAYTIRYAVYEKYHVFSSRSRGRC